MKELNGTSFKDVIANNSKVVVDFWAPWCMPCRMLVPIFQELEKEMDGISFTKVNVDENPELAKSFGIMSIPTIIVFLNGKEMDRLIGVIPKEELKANILKVAK
jgi:thioredoxin 1